MATIKAFSDLEQSRKLAEILPLESADMCFNTSNNMPPLMTPYSRFNDFFNVSPTPAFLIPCWSLAALLEIIPYGQVNKAADDSNKWEASSWNETDFDPILSVGGFDNPVDACYEMILKLYELNLL